MPILPPGPSPRRFTEAWTSSFKEAVVGAAGRDGRLSMSEAKRIAGRADGLRVFGNNAVNYLTERGQASVSVNLLLANSTAAVERAVTEAAGADGRLAAADAQRLRPDLQDDFQYLRGIVKYEPLPTPFSLPLDVRDAALRALDSGAVVAMSGQPPATLGLKPALTGMLHPESGTRNDVYVANGQLYLSRTPTRAGGASGFWAAGPAPAPNTGRGELRAKIEAAADGIWNVSDRDAKVRFVSAEGPTGAISETLVRGRLGAAHDLLAQTIYDSQTGGVSTLRSRGAGQVGDAQAYLSRRADSADPSDPVSVAQAKKWAELQRVLNAELTDLTLVRFGDVEVSTFLVGRTKNGDLAGVLTASIET